MKFDFQLRILISRNIFNKPISYFESDLSSEDKLLIY